MSVTTYPATRTVALPPGAREVNDVHSQLNRTWVRGVAVPSSLEELQAIVRRARAPLCVAGGRHAMGGQQFGTGSVLVDMRSMRRVLKFEPDRREIEVEAGIQWPELIDFTTRAQAGRSDQVGIVQKQTGADRLSLGGALASNVHGRGLRLAPIVGDVESFVLVDAGGAARRCSRTENADLFRLAIGGYGLFGVVASVTLRLAPRRKLERVVELVDLAGLMPTFERRAAEGCLYGDFQYVTDSASEGFLTRGILSCYRPAPDDAPVPEGQKELSPAEWRELYYLAHTDRARAYEVYSGHYLATSGQVYWSDTHQLSVYLDGYHRELDRRTGASVRATEMISELYVPRPALAGFMAAVRGDFLQHRPELVYGTVRLIERDEETFLPWAKEPYACVVFNLHVPHSAGGIAKAKADFRRLVDRAVERGGSFFLTYHRWATREQVEACYPQFREFLRLKGEHDPGELFQSDWYRHYRGLFGGGR